jgi:7,8-dihydropterin-6-yl-methyl-4-(beta-D-ribofuranosyl)aminobenzene 5'-phosphate synthase
MQSTGPSVTILVDNQAGVGLVGEHGLSILIEADGLRILFDTGQGVALPSNVRALDAVLSRIDNLVLSHGHYDHTGGLPQVLQNAPNAKVYCHPGVVHLRYAVRNGDPKPIHMPHPSIAIIDKLSSDRLCWVQKPLRLSADIGITGPIPRRTGYEDTGGPFYLDPQARRPDPIDDDQALWIRTPTGLIVCVGCSHAGIVNTLKYVRRLNDGLRIRAVIGGFHLIDAGRARIEKTLAALRQMAVDRLVPCHCTGASATAALQAALGKTTTPGEAGMKIRF